MATLVRLLGDLDLAEEAMHEAFAAALGRQVHGRASKTAVKNLAAFLSNQMTEMVSSDFFLEPPGTQPEVRLPTLPIIPATRAPDKESR